MAMHRSASPLRYPGGKSCLYELIADVLRENNLERVQYAEPYAGGCGLALSLLYGGHVSDIHLNDLDPAIWSFWKSTLDSTDELIELIEKATFSRAEWLRQRQIHDACDFSNPLKLGFATFYLNRTNRSGIIKGAGMIGGLAQLGFYKMNCRFNKEELVRRVRRVGKYRDRIHLYRKDAIDFMASISEDRSRDYFLCIDPPYFSKGSKLYTNFYGPTEHAAVAKAVIRLKQPYVVTYDYHEEIVKIYLRRRQFLFDISYSLQTKRKGEEILIASRGLKLPKSFGGVEVFPAKLPIEAFAGRVAHSRVPHS